MNVKMAVLQLFIVSAIAYDFKDLVMLHVLDVAVVLYYCVYP